MSAIVLKSGHFVKGSGRFFVYDNLMPPKTTLAERIKIGRAHAGIASQSDLARKMRVNRQTVSRWCTGEGTKPEPEMLVKLADALQVSVRWLAIGDGNINKREELSEQEREFVILLRLLHPAAKEHCLNQIRDLVKMVGENGATNPFGVRRKQR